MPPGHEIAVDVNRAKLFCCACKDQVYNRDFDAAVILAQTTLSMLASLATSAVQQCAPENLWKRHHIDNKSWIPNMREQYLVADVITPQALGPWTHTCPLPRAPP
ncbi:ubiquitin carboxyl-terminal hydrolase 22-like [Pyrus ussuriensis x Pyrus communis]|uniref:Ubiquitin carboxyl-terminal hydrolase 22-like n=1 Tax=Pyrus ussuriensis x Pyrus communis TaxID=2448454 RepID=A0A5N5HPU4_9ROSA|nr:ubiquitin carboxyl-terminal hydrolase 22-like [Pyrus ussuriensis x Pyrus communis]